MPNLQTPVRRVVTVNASGGAFVTISPSGPCRYMEISECPPNAGTYDGTNFNPTGCNYQRADEAYANTYALLPGATLALGDRSFGRDRQIGIPAGMTDPAGQAIAQSVIGTIKIKSATAGTTQVEVDEYN